MAAEPVSPGGKARAAVAELGTSARVFREIWSVPDLRRAQLAFTGFSMAEWATFISILVYAFERGGAGAVGLVSVVQLVPAALFAPFASLLGDRYRREVMLVVAYLVQALTMGATAAALLLDAPVPVVYALAAVTATGYTLVRPLHGALLPALARSPGQLTAGYVADGVIESVSVMIGPAVAGAIMAVSEPGSVYAVASAALVASAFLAARIETRTSPAGRAEGTRVVEEALAGFEIVRHDGRPRFVIGLLGAELLFLGLVDVLVVAMAFDLFGSGDSGTGFLSAAIGAGGVLGSAWTVTLIGRRRLSGPMRNGLHLSGLPVALIAAVPAQGFAVPMLAAAGAGMHVTDVSGRTMLQRLVPDENLSRVLGVLEGSYMAAEAAGAVLGAVLVDTLGIRGALLAAGLLLPVLGLAASRRLAAADVGTLVPAEDIRFLHSLPIFAALGPAELERVAAHLFLLRVAAGEVVIREGDAGDRLYLIKRGRAEATKGSRRLGGLTAGELFGEIALLRDVPRTATVRALTEMELLCLERAPFLEAVNPHPVSVQIGDELVASRLARQHG
jgi:MFS family permease